MSTAAVPLEMAVRSDTTPSLLIFQICTARVSAGRNTFHGHDGLEKSRHVKSSTGADWPAVKISAAASPKARVMPRRTAVISDGAALLSTTFHMVCQRVHPSA